MEFKAFRRRRVQEAMKDSNVQILIASLPQSIAYLTGGYVSAGQNVLCSSQAYVAYLLPEGKLYCIVGHAEIPSVLEFEGGNAEIVPFGAFRFAYADTFPKPPDIPSMSRKQRAPHYRRFSIRFASWSRPIICKPLWIPAVYHTKLPPAYLQHSPRHLFPAQQYSIRLA